MPKSKANSRPDNRSQKLLKAEKIPSSIRGLPALTPGQRAQAERGGRASADAKIVKSREAAKLELKKEKARKKEKTRRALNAKSP